MLVVDDEPAARGVVSHALRRAGFEVVEAASGEEALRRVDAGRVDLLVLDVSMPGMSGFEVVESLRQNPANTTLPIVLVTGSGEQDALLHGLAAGATDFLGKPVRLDELVARIHAHLRLRDAWTQQAADALKVRASVVAALGRLAVSGDPVEAAATVVGEVGQRSGARFTAFLQLSGDHLSPLATYDLEKGTRRAGRSLAPQESHHLLARSREGPWVEVLGPGDRVPGGHWPAAIGAMAGVPIHGGAQLVGVFVMAVAGPGDRMSQAARTALLAAAIDYGGLLSAAAGVAMRDRREAVATRARLRRVLADRRFHPVFQAIVDVGTRAIVGYEALTRFADGTPPAVRFADATASGLGSDYELAALEAALAAAPSDLPTAAFLTLNVSPELVASRNAHLRRLLRGADRALVLELTEHAPIDDYQDLRAAVGELGPFRLAVDDAGAGYSSLRHIVELQPAFVKLDISIVRGIESDPLRQALVAGLQHYAVRTGCQLIAEGVETEPEAAAVADLGVALAQGFLFGQPGVT